MRSAISYSLAFCRRCGFSVECAFFFVAALFLNGLGGIALFGTFTIAFIALRKRFQASGPSIISG
jgi:hypothetical protein